MWIYVMGGISPILMLIPRICQMCRSNLMVLHIIATFGWHSKLHSCVSLRGTAIGKCIASTVRLLHNIITCMLASKQVPCQVRVQPDFEAMLCS
jgi:hypothetical protein